MTRHRRAWLIFAAGTLVVFAAVGEMSRMVLRLDREGAAARRQALIEENVRLALWRMDAAFSLFVARESLRPYFEFRALVPEHRAWNELFDPLLPNELLAPSPLLATVPDRVNLYFQVEPDGSITSPEVPPPSSRALPAGASFGKVEATRVSLAKLQPVIRRIRVPSAIEPPRQALEQAAREQGSWAQVAGRDIGSWSTSNAAPAQQPRSEREYMNRSSLQQYIAPQVQEAQAPPAAIEIPSNVMTPVWQDGDLFLVRSVVIGGSQYVQGCWLDWPGVSKWLLDEVPDLLPNASLVAASGPQHGEERRLASLPADLIPGTVAVHDVAGGAPALLVLVVAWVGVLIAVMASALLLRGALELSERRGAFVSAVTHELRTPLTTFRMYTEMLSEGMIASPEQRQTYVGTLQCEADRLTHLVENVLAYSRVEQGRAPATTELVDLSPILDRILPRLVERTSQGGMELISRRESGIEVRTDAAAIEQILFNVVDNACKYATPAQDERIELTVTARGREVRISVRDHGPGISADVLRRLFQPFSKSAAAAAMTAPGIGLGLALCRQLARSRGGDLRYSPAAGGGAEFVLSLPGRRDPTPA